MNTKLAFVLTAILGFVTASYVFAQEAVNTEAAMNMEAAMNTEAAMNMEMPNSVPAEMEGNMVMNQEEPAGEVAAPSTEMK